jgi:hypothetical protein
MAECSCNSCNGYKWEYLREYTRCFFKRQTAEALKVKEQIDIALNSKLLEEESNAKFRNYIDNALMAFCC